MPIDASTPDSPGWWLQKCARKLTARLSRLEKLNNYREGNPPLPEGAKAAIEAYRDFQKKARLNLADLISESVRERQTVRAIRTAAEDQESGDEKAWALYKANGLEVEFPDVLDNMLALGDSYMIVGVDPEAADLANLTEDDITITGEDPRQCVTIHDPARQSRIRAGAKIFHDPDEGRDYAYLFIRSNGRRYVATRSRKAPGPRVTFSPASWDWDETRGGAEGEAYPVAGPIMPMVRFRNRRGVSEFEPHIDVLDRINHMILQRMVIATMQAFKQRGIIGDLPDVYPAGHPMAGQTIDYDGMFSADPGALWMIPAAAQIWESGQVDLSGILNAVKDDIRNLAAVTRRPLAIFAPDNQSAAGAQAASEGLVFATEDRNTRAGQGLAQVMHLAFTFLGDTTRAQLSKIDIEWMPVERYSLTDKAAAAAQSKAAGMSARFILENCWQATPEQIGREQAFKMDDAMLTATFAVPAPAGPAPTAV